MKRLLVLVLAVVFAGAFAVPVIAGEVRIGGEMCLETSWYNQSEDASATGEARTDTHFDLSKKSKVTMMYTNADTKLIFGFKCLGVTAPPGSLDVQLDVLFGMWNFSPGNTLIVGHAPDVVLGVTPDQMLKDKWGLNAYGNFAGAKGPKVGYARKADWGGFEIDAIFPVKDVKGYMGGVPHAVFPRIEGKLDFKVADATITPSGSFNSFEAEGPDETVQSWVVGADVVVPLGMAKITGEAYYGQNLYIYTPCFAGTDHAPALVAGELEENTVGYGGFLALAFPFEPATLNVGGGMGVAANDEKGDDVTQMSFFGNIRYPLAKGFIITPEIAYFDNGDNWDGTDRGTEIWYGLHWDMMF